MFSWNGLFDEEFGGFERDLSRIHICIESMLKNEFSLKAIIFIKLFFSFFSSYCTQSLLLYLYLHFIESNNFYISSNFIDSFFSHSSLRFIEPNHFHIYLGNV